MMVCHGVVGDWRLSDGEFMASFRLPAALDKHDVLRARHPFPIEDRLALDEVAHTYTFDGVVVPTSVTTLVHRYCGGFDPLRALAVMKSRESWEWKQQQFIG